MRILFYSDAASWSGAVRVFAAAARGLATRGHEVAFACVGGSDVERRLRMDSYEILPIAGERGTIAPAWRLGRALRARFVEVVFVDGTREQRIAALAANRAGRAAIVRRVPLESPLELGWKDRASLRLVHTLFLSTDEGRGRERFPPASPTSPVAPLGVDIAVYDGVRPAPRAAFADAAAERVIACVYHPRGRARIATALRVAALLAARHPELRLVVIGPGSGDPELRMHAAALRIARVVSFLGERDDHLSVLRAADLGWVAAESDDAAYAMLDLAALGVPVLAERTDLGQRYIADGITGLLFAPGDAPASAAAIARLLAGAEERAAMGSAGHARVAREFGESPLVDGFEQAAALAADRTRW